MHQLPGRKIILLCGYEVLVLPKGIYHFRGNTIGLIASSERSEEQMLLNELVKIVSMAQDSDVAAIKQL